MTRPLFKQLWKTPSTMLSLIISERTVPGNDYFLYTKVDILLGDELLFGRLIVNIPTS